MLAQFNNDTVIIVYLISAFVLGALGYSFKVSAIICVVGCIIIYANTTYYGDHRDAQNINAGLIAFLLPLFWILHKIPSMLRRLVFPIQQWIIEYWTSRK